MKFKERFGVYFTNIEVLIISAVLMATACGIYFLGVRTGYVAAEKQLAESQAVNIARYPIEKQSEELDPTKSTAVYSRLTDNSTVQVDPSPSQIPVAAIQNQKDAPVEIPDRPVEAKSFNDKPLHGWYVSSSEVLTAEEGDLLVERLRGLGFVALLEQPKTNEYAILVGPETSEKLATRQLEQLQSEHALSGELVVKQVN